MFAHIVIKTDEGKQVINNIKPFMVLHLIMDLVNNSDKVVIVKSTKSLQKDDVLKLVD